MALQVYGIPSCSTCKKALRWLDDHGIEYQFIDTKVSPPSQVQIADWVAALGAKSMRNTSGQAYRSLGTEKQTWDDARWVSAFADTPMLLKRPLFVKDGKAVLVGFRADQEVLQATLST